jgi:hypothetical protein
MCNFIAVRQGKLRAVTINEMTNKFTWIHTKITNIYIYIYTQIFVRFYNKIFLTTLPKVCLHTWSLVVFLTSVSEFGCVNDQDCQGAGWVCVQKRCDCGDGYVRQDAVCVNVTGRSAVQLDCSRSGPATQHLILFNTSSNSHLYFTRITPFRPKFSVFPSLPLFETNLQCRSHLYPSLLWYCTTRYLGGKWMQ